MKTTYIFIVTLFYCINICAQVSPEILWSKNFGGTSADGAKVILNANDGGYVAAGLTQSTDIDVSENYGQADGWVTKISESGEIIFEKNYGGSIWDDITAGVIADDGYVLAGSTSSNDFDISGMNGGYDFWIIKIDNDGELLWSYVYGGSGVDGAMDMQRTDDGGFIMVGYSYSQDDGDVTGHHGTTTYSDYWIIKLNESGILEWQKSLGGIYEDVATSVNVLPDGNYLVSGRSNSNDFDVIDHLGTVLNRDAWVVKLNGAGDILWTKSFSYNGDLLSFTNDYISNSFTTDSAYFFCGITEDELGELNDGWIFSIDTAGNLLWEKTIGGTEDDLVTHIFVNPSNECLISGYTYSSDNDLTTNYGLLDAWLIKLDTAAEIIYSENYGGTLTESFTDFLINDDGSIVACGNSNSDNIDLEDNYGLNDLWVVKFECDLMQTFYADVDEDGYGDILSSINDCSLPTGYVTDNTDCDDADSLINPAATEICNLMDDNCNVMVDEDLFLYTLFIDADADNFGNSFIDTISCFTFISGYILDNTDCDDSNPFIYPGADETFNGVDDNCNDLIDEGVEIENTLNADIQVYPNPATNKLIIVVTPLSPSNSPVTITDIYGKIVAKLMITYPSTEIDVSDFTSGVYFVNVIDLNVSIMFIKK